MSIIEMCSGKFSAFFPEDFRELSLRKRLCVVAKDFLYGTVGLFVLDVSWRFMDLFIDFICDHVHWLKFLSDNTGG